MTRTTPQEAVARHGCRALAVVCGIALALVPAADARLGDFDPSFDGDGVAEPALGTPGSLRAVVQLPDGRVLAGGSSEGQMLVLRLTQAGQLDPGFGPVRFVPPGNEVAEVEALALEADGDVLAAGAAASGSRTNPSPSLVRISPAGVATPVPLPPVGLGWLFGVAVMRDGEIVVGGWTTANQTEFLAIRLLPGDIPDPSFGAGGVATVSFPNAAARAHGLAVAADGSVTLAGSAQAAGTAQQQPAAARLTAAGVPDRTFNGTGQRVFTVPGRFLAAAPRGDQVLAAGSRAGEALLERLRLDGGSDVAPSTWPSAVGHAVAATATGGAVVAGRAISGNAESLQTAWLDPSGAPDPAGGGLRVHPVALAPGTGVGLARTEGDGVVVAGTTPAQRPVVVRLLPNAAPTAALGGPAEVVAGAPATFDAGGTTDPEGEALRYAFDLDGDGSFEFDGGQNPLALRSFPTPGRYSVGVAAFDPRGDTSTATHSVNVVPVVTPAGTQSPQPVLGRQGVAAPVRGVVRYRLPGTREFLVLTGLTAIPNGTEIDARDGRILLTVLHDASGRLDGAEFFGGRFIFSQGSGAVPVTTLRLSGGSFRGCPTARRRGRTLMAVVAQNGKRKTVRKLWGDGRGRFRTKGRYGAATVRGTKWLTKDRCDGTKVRVVRGEVGVRDLVRAGRRPRLLRAGDAILIRRRGG